MQLSTTQLCSLILIIGTVLLIFLERKFPYRRGIPFLEMASGLMLSGIRSSKVFVENTNI